MVNFFKGTKDKASFFLSLKSGYHTKSRMIQENDPLPSQDATSRGKEGAERSETITFTHFKPYLSKNVFSIAA